MRHPSLLFVLPVALATVAACHKDSPTPTGASSAAPPVAVAPTSPPVPLDRLTEAREGSTIALAKLGDKKVALVSDEDGSAIRVIDLTAGTEVGSLAIAGRPGALVVTKEGKLLVALRDDAAILLVEAHADGSLKGLDRIPTQTEPIALALSPDDRSLFVACAWSHTLEGYSLATKARFLSVVVAREPRAVLVSQDGTHAFVAHGATGVVEAVDIQAQSKKAIDLGIAEVTFQMPAGHSLRRPMLQFEALIPAADDGIDDCFDCGSRFPHSPNTVVDMPARFARQGFALARLEAHDAKGKSLGERILVPHVEVMPGDPREITSGYGGGSFSEDDGPLPTNAFTMSILTTEKRTALHQVGFATDKTTCQLPRAAVVSKTHVFVACLGSDSLFAYPLDPKGDVGAKTDRRIPVASGPTGVALDPEADRAAVFSSFDGVLTLVSTTISTRKDAGAPEKTEIRLQRKSSLTEAQLEGRKLFHDGGDPRIAADGRSCTSCHPDGRDDGLTWSTPNGPRQTIQLAGRVNRPAPFGWMGKHASLQIHMTQTMKNLDGKGLAPNELDSLAAYLNVMKGPPQKWRALTAEESRGRDLFASSDTGCSSCHAEKTGFTDHDVHDVRSATFVDTTRSFLVPSLAGVGGSAPYFHDGRYTTLDELLTKTDGTMGTTKALSPDDKKALIAYLKTL